MQGDIVAELTWVDGLGNVRRDSRDSDAGRALVGGLGVAGLVTELLLQLEPPSLTAVDTRFKQHDGKLFEDVMDMLQVGTDTGPPALLRMRSPPPSSSSSARFPLPSPPLPSLGQAKWSGLRCSYSSTAQLSDAYCAYHGVYVHCAGLQLAAEEHATLPLPQVGARSSFTLDSVTSTLRSCGVLYVVRAVLPPFVSCVAP